MTFGLILLGLPLLWTTLSLAALASQRRTQSASRVEVTGDPVSVANRPQSVSVLKPLAGFDPGLRENLMSFFELEGNYELLFGWEGDAPELEALLTELEAAYPHVPVVRIKHGESTAKASPMHPACISKNRKQTSGKGASNPKIRNLLAMLPAAKHPWLLVSDSNVRAEPDYLVRSTNLAAKHNAKLVTHTFVAEGEQSLAAVLEAVQLNGFTALGVAVPMLLGDAAVIGKSMFLERTALEQVDGFERVAHVLAEDFLLGKMFEHAGYKVIVSDQLLRCHLGKVSFEHVWRRHQRWASMRYRLRPLAFALEPMTSGLFVSFLASLCDPKHALGYCMIGANISLARDLGAWLILRGLGRAWIPFVAMMPKELLMGSAWLFAPWLKKIVWRGNRLRLGAGSFLFQESKRGQRLGR
jgi:ceramide glucosyltransferase